MSASSNNSVSTATTASTTATSCFPKKLFLPIPPTATYHSVRQAMQGRGAVKDIVVPLNEHGQNRGFAFVTFQWHEDALAAMEDLDGTVMDGLIIHPCWAAPKSNNKKKQKKKRNGSWKRKKPKAVEE